jgi:hypothetical protein
LASLGHDARALPGPINGLDAAKATLDAALRAEGETLTSAYEATEAGGAASADAVSTLRSAQAAHARSNAAAREVRALKAQAARLNAAPEHPAPPPAVEETSTP